MELLGIAPEDIQLLDHDGAVTFRAKKRIGREEGDWTDFFCKRDFGAFQRPFRLPADAAAERIKAVSKNGASRSVRPRPATAGS